VPLFRYFTPDRGLQVLRTLELVAVPPKYLNDPFEFSPIIKCENPEAFTRSKFEEITTSPAFFDENKSHFPVGCTFEQFQTALRRREPQLLQQLESEVPGVDLRVQTEAQDIISKSFGVICFAADGLHPIMWAHYASSHSGLIIEFHEDHLLFSGHSFLKVEYSDEPFIYDASNRARRDNVELFATRKGSDWSHERESRLVIELSHIAPPRETSEGRRYFLPIEPQLITSVTLGLRVSDNFKGKVVESVQASHFGHVELFKIMRNINSDALERTSIRSRKL
jgi:hypothetical protein